MILCAVDALYAAIGFGEHKGGDLQKILQITVPESLEYGGMFDDLFEQFTAEARLVRVKTTSLGSLNRLTYEIRLRKSGTEKAFIDQLRCRNGNLEISIQNRSEDPAEL